MNEFRFQMRTNAWWEEQSVSNSVLIRRVVSIVIVTLVTIVTTDFLTSAWTLMSVQRAGQTVTSAWILKEGNEPKNCKILLSFLQTSAGPHTSFKEGLNQDKTEELIEMYSGNFYRPSLDWLQHLLWKLALV